MSWQTRVRQHIIGTPFEGIARRLYRHLKGQQRTSPHIVKPIILPKPKSGEGPVDLTGYFDYETLIEEEKEEYSNIELKDDLTSGGVHANEAWHYYWRAVNQVLRQSDYGNRPGFIDRTFGGRDTPIRILSLGSGYCGHEIKLASQLNSPYEITCTDINEALFNRAKEEATEKHLNMSFRIEDLNFIEIEHATYDVIFAHAVLHHVINLERLYDQIANGLQKNGVLHLVEVVGMNRKLIWPENEAFANALLRTLPEDISEGYQLDVPVGDHGMEGVRQEDIMPALAERFDTLYEYSHGAFMRFFCTNPYLGKRLDPNSPRIKQVLDFLIAWDIAAVDNGILRPLEVWGFYKPKQ
jgi:2-polyprenyl-3-methyl-5-hydroxy-6-metoxy-1,4-benzoquinol methylase